jgi:Divergent InlB B-repeat domain
VIGTVGISRRPRLGILFALVLTVGAALPASASATARFYDDFADSAADASPSGKNWVEPADPDLDSATKEAEEPDHAGYAGGHSVWTSWPMSEDVGVRAKACDVAGADLLLAVYTGDAVDELTEVGSDSEENANGCVIVDFAAKKDTMYRIALDAKSSPGTTSAYFDMDRFAPNDDFADAIVLPELPVSPTIDPELATSEPEEPGLPKIGSGNSVWYRWTPTKSGLARLNYCEFWGSASFRVYTGSALGELTQIAAGSGGGSSCGRGREARFEAEEGITYSIAVEGYAGKTIRLRPSFEWVPKTPLSVSKSGSGSGTVVSEPVGIECGGSCEASFYRGPLVYGQILIALTAVPDPGSVFVGWSGEGWRAPKYPFDEEWEPGCGSEPVCEFSMFAAPTEVTAEFEEVPSLVIPGEEPGTGSTPPPPSLQTPAAPSPQVSTSPQRKKPNCAKRKKKGKKGAKAKASKRRACKR